MTVTLVFAVYGTLINMHDVVSASPEVVGKKAARIKRADDTIFDPWDLSGSSPVGV